MPTITPQGRNIFLLNIIRDSLVRRYGRRISWNEVLSEMFREIERIRHLEARITELEDKYESEKDHHTHFAETIALELARKQAAPMMMQANPIMQQANLTPPPPIPSIAPPKPIQQLSVNVKQDYQNEIKGLLTGAPIKPSQIAKLNGNAGRKIIEAETAPFLKEKPQPYYEVKSDE